MDPPRFKLPVFRSQSRPTAADQIPGVTHFSLDQHKELKVLGRGSFGTVRLFEDSSGDKVAVKSFTPPFDHAAIRKEVRLLSSLQHENIVRLIGFSGTLLAMEYCVFDFSVFGEDQTVSSLGELLGSLDATYFRVRFFSLEIIDQSMNMHDDIIIFNRV